MSTPTFNPTAEAFDDVRLYTELDPYYYTIDNRPLQDIVENVGSLGSSSDAARRAALIEALKGSSVMAGLFGSTKKITGLRATATSASTLTVDPGALLAPGNISEGDTRQVLRTAASPLPVILACPAPVTLSREFTYLVQIKFTDLTGAATYPNYDASNSFLPSTLLNGYLAINIIAGAEANLGASVAPTVTPGWDPLYTVVAAAGASLPVITASSSAPSRINSISAEESWVSPTLTNGWVNIGGAYQTAQYKRVGNRVFIRGSISSGTAGSTVFVLPVGYRPLANSVYLASTGGGVVYVNVNSTGAVSLPVSSSTHFGLIEFWLD